MRLKLLCLTAAWLAVMPGVSAALGLGDIQLKSALNAPLNAEIELLEATAEELNGVRAQIASRDTFARYGLDYPAFLTGIQVRRARSTDGREIIQLTSTAPMTEPFATVLVEASWARGRLVREYTVLFDPPIFAPPAGAQAPASVATPTVGAGERSGEIVRPATGANAEPSLSGDVYRVVGGDSLSGIVQRSVGGGADTQRRAMIAIYRANPEAFQGNINVLRSGAVLRLPDSAALAAIDSSEAAAEVRRQSSAWSGGGSVSADSRLRLVPPTGAGGTGTADPAETRELKDRVAQLESELAESRRLLALRNADLARLQSGVAPTTTPAEVPATPPAEAPATPTPAAEPTPPVAQEPPPVEPAPKAEPVVPEAPSGPSLVDRLKSLWYIPVGLLALGAGFLALRAARRGREDSFDNMGNFGAASGGVRDTSSDTFPLRKPMLEPQDTFLVEESGTHERPQFGSQAPRNVDVGEPGGATNSPQLDATAALEQGDPLAEADFHMAYGLYDQAADLVRLAIQREPSRRDLKLKLLEVFFVWGNKEQFLKTAGELAKTRAEAHPGEWEKTVIMGKQLAPEEPMFANAAGGMGSSDVDLNLEGGQNRIDFDLHDGPSAQLTSDGGMDLDLGAALGSNASQGVGISLDFALDDPLRGADDGDRTATTRQMIQPEFGGDAATLRFTGADGSEGPTVEQPQINNGETLRQKVDAQLQVSSSDQTAELALDDLGLDLGRMDATGSNLLDESRLTQVLESADAPTLVAGLDDTSRRIISDAQQGLQPTELLPLGDIDTGATSRVSALDFELGTFDDTAATGTREGLSADSFGLDLDVGTVDPASNTYVKTQRIDPADVAGLSEAEADLEPVTMSEVGTKLDLARAYMDMGDPDGARNILTEVMQEGSVNQKQEAQRLLDSIPG